MWSYQTSRNVIAVFMVLLLVAVPLMAQSEGGYAEGKADGERDGSGSAVWGLAGCFLGCIGIVIAYLVKPSPPASSLIGKSSEYTAAYTEAYKAKAAKNNALWAAGGCVATTLVIIIMDVIIYGTLLPNLTGGS
jgi:hypothetical protein